MNYLWLRILIIAAVVIALTFYLYDEGARRVYDVCISAVVIIVTSPVFAVVAAVCAIKNKRVFNKTDGLKFTYPNNGLGKLPFFLLVFVGKCNIMPKRLFKRSQ